MLAQPRGNGKQFLTAFDKWRSCCLFFEEELLICFFGVFFFCFSGATQNESEVSLCGCRSFALIKCVKLQTQIFFLTDTITNVNAMFTDTPNLAIASS